MMEVFDENIKLTCPKCNGISYIQWNNVIVDDGCDPRYGEFECPACGKRHGVYTMDPIKDIIDGTGHVYYPKK